MIWAVDPDALEAHLVESFEDHAPALAALIELQASHAWTEHALVLTSWAHLAEGRGIVQRVAQGPAWASCLVECADGRRRVRP